MKFHYKTIITISIMIILAGPLHARDIILIENLASQAEGEALVGILQKQFSIPRRLITLKNKKVCQKNTEAIMHLCLKINSDLEIVKMNKFVVEETLAAFMDLEE
jgi:hypothetical protein